MGREFFHLHLHDAAKWKWRPDNCTLLTLRVEERGTASLTPLAFSTFSILLSFHRPKIGKRLVVNYP